MGVKVSAVEGAMRFGTGLMRLARMVLLGSAAGIAAAAVCFSLGYLLAVRFAPAGAYFGVGLEPWNLPGTILGLATYAFLIFRLAKKGW